MTRYRSLPCDLSLIREGSTLGGWGQARSISDVGGPSHPPLQEAADLAKRSKDPDPKDVFTVY